MAFLHFAQGKRRRRRVGSRPRGRLDSTNVCRPEVCIITSISFDHTKQLGNTLAAIASEKAGIIKLGIPITLASPTPNPATSSPPAPRP